MRCEGTTRKELTWSASRPSAARALMIEELTGLAVQQVTGSNKPGISLNQIWQISWNSFIVDDKPEASWRRALRVCVEGSPWIKRSVDAWNYVVYPRDEGRAAQILSSHNTFTATFLLAGVVQNTSARDAKKSQWRRARSEGHTVTWRTFFFFFSSDSKKQCQSGSSLARRPEGSSRSFKLELFVYCGEGDAKRLSVYSALSTLEIICWVHCEIISLGVTQGKLILSQWLGLICVVPCATPHREKGNPFGTFFCCLWNHLASVCLKMLYCAFVLVFLCLSELYLESSFKFLKSTIQMKSKTTIIYNKNVTIGKKVNFSSWILFCSATRKSILSFFVQSLYNTWVTPLPSYQQHTQRGLFFFRSQHTESLAKLYFYYLFRDHYYSVFRLLDH